jgi:diguanylate cyclase (GGDEF)-like protein/PAS domain S-box-containing protein
MKSPKSQQSGWQWPQLLLANLFIVAVYLGERQLSDLLDLPPGYATPFFPPAGVGLALAVSAGWRVLPGIALGSLLLHLPSVWLGPGVAPATGALAALAASAGSVLQAGVGARLFRRWVQPAIDSGPDVLRFLLLTPLVCLVSASVAVPSLYRLGLLPRDELLAAWLSWWAGDIVGVLLAAPLCWIVVGRPRPLWRRRAVLLAVPLLAAAAAVVATYEQAIKWEHGQHLQEFRLKAQQVGDQLQAKFSEHERFIYALARALGDAPHMLPRGEFSAIAQAYLANRRSLTAVEWIPRITHAERAAFERWARRTVDPGFAVREVGPDGRLAPALPRSEYYPLLYTEPKRYSEWLGLDHKTEPVRRGALEGALRSGKPVASTPLRLPGAQPRFEVALLQAVGMRGPGLPPTGLLGLVLDLGGTLRLAITDAHFTGFVAAFGDVTDAAAPVRLIDAIGRPPQADDYGRQLGFGARRYQLWFAPSAAFLEQQPSWTSWTVLTGGLFMTGLLGGLLLLISGERARIEALVTDRTMRLRDREARLQAILDNAADAILTVDSDGNVVSANAATAALFGYTPAELPGMPFGALVPGKGDEHPDHLLGRLAHADPAERELRGLDRRGEPFPLQISVSRVLLPTEHLFVCILRDLTAQRRSQEHIYRLAHHDALTGLENRFALNERLEQQLAHARRSAEPVAVLFIDLDHFKKINDSHGHQAGDQLLVAAAQRMRELLRDVDALGRLGGDEFIIVLGGPLTPDSVSAVAVRVVQSLSAPYHLDAGTVHSGASVGVALYPGDGADRETLLRHADIAMYAAKREGRGNFQFFSPAMNAATHEHLMIENRMWLALEHGAFELHLQAQVALDTGRLIGAEALLRWHDPELGNVEPGRFIPIAEECGLIVPLGDWVLARAMQQLADWQSAGLGDLRLAVNLSARQFSGGALVARLDQLLAQHRIAPSRLELEITETAAMRDPENTRALLRQLRARGFKLAIDDFGTGYSSLAYLKQFAIDRIKIDRAFVQDLETNQNDAVIVAATIGLAHSLGLAVVAEGVETRGQWCFLRDKRGDEAQGFLFGRPMPPSDFLDFIREPALQVPGP